LSKYEHIIFERERTITRITFNRPHAHNALDRQSMVNALVVRKTQLPTLQKTFRAAQYVRMSTDNQRHSIENQAAVIAAYAQLHDLSIIRAYRDEARAA